jgi:hypothetical protein
MNEPPPKRPRLNQKEPHFYNESIDTPWIPYSIIDPFVNFPALNNQPGYLHGVIGSSPTRQGTDWNSTQPLPNRILSYDDNQPSSFNDTNVGWFLDSDVNYDATISGSDDYQRSQAIVEDNRCVQNSCVAKEFCFGMVNPSSTFRSVH